MARQTPITFWKASKKNLSLSNKLHKFFQKRIQIGIGFLFILALLLPNFLTAVGGGVDLNGAVGCAVTEGVSKPVINLTWISYISGTPDFHILRKAEGETNYTEIGVTYSTSYTDTNVSSDINYIYQIKAIKGSSTYYSNEKTFPAAYCQPVFALPATSCQNDGPYVDLSWSSISGDLSTYEVYRDGAKIYSTTAPNFSDGPSIEGTKDYNYFIKAIWQNGNSTTTEGIQVTAPACPPTLTATADCLIDTAPGGPKINLSWNSLLGIKSYQIYRKTQSQTEYSLLTTFYQPPEAISYADYLVESLSDNYWQEAQISYYVKAFWQDGTTQNSAQKEITVSRCSPYLKVESNCDEFSFRLSWTRTPGATHYNIYRDDQFLYQNSGVTNSSYSDGLDLDICPGQICNYTYQVEAVVTGLPNMPSNSVAQSIDCATIRSPSPAPILTTPAAYCETGDSRIKLNWSPSENVTYYGLYRGGTNVVNQLETLYEDTGVQSGYEYTYWVTAYGKGGTSTTSNSQIVTAVDCTSPSIPTLNLSTGCATGQPYINLSWSLTTNTLAYDIYRGTSASGLSLLITFDQTAPEFTSRSWQDTDVPVSTTYYYKVVSRGPTGVPSSNSNTISITTPSCFPTTPVLTLSRACESGAPTVGLSWTTNGANTTRYEIFRQDYSPTTPIKIIYDASTTAWKDTCVSPETTYNYKVEAVGYLDTIRTTQGYKAITTYNCAPPGPLTLADPTVYCQGSYPKSDLSWTTSTNAASYDLNRLLSQPTTFYNIASPFTDFGFGNALDFDGGDYVELENSLIPLTGNLTIEFWTKPLNVSYARQNPICKSYGGEFCLTMETDGSLSYYHGSCGGNCWPYMSFNTSNLFVNNTWVHVVITRDISARTMRSYKNGAFANSATWSSSYDPIDSAITLKVGRGYVYDFVGIIDEVRIYNRVLSAAEAQQHYQGTYSDETGLIGLWHFDEGSPSQSASDSSNYGNNGRLGRTTGINNSDPTWVQNGLQSGTNYQWQVQANGPGGSTLSNTTNSATTPLCSPTKPGLVVTPLCEGGANLPAATLTWSYTIATAKYEIYRQDKGLIKTINQGDAEFSSRIWTDNNDNAGLAPAAPYTYYVKAIGPSGLTSQSDFISGTALNCVLPSQPTNLTAAFVCSGTGNSYPQLNLSWDPAADATSYMIYRTPTGSLFPATTTVPLYTDNTMTVNTNYSYYVVAYSPAGPSSPSDAFSITTGYCLPSTPSIIALSTDCESSAPFNKISWSDDTTFNTDSYKIYRNTSDSPPATPVITVASTTPEFTSRTWEDYSGLSPSTTYYYWVKAAGPAGESADSPSKSIATYGCGLAPTAPTLNLDNLNCSNNLPQADLSWNTVPNAYSYNLYRTNPDASQSIYSTRLSPFNERGSAALNFDGSDDYISIADSASLNPEQITLEAWIYPTAFVYYGNIITKRYPGQYFLRLYYNTGRVQGYVYSDGNWRYCTTPSSVSVSLNQWNHVVFTFNDNMGRVYVNGVQGCAFTYTGEICSGNAPLQIGSYYTYPNQNERFNGAIDEVRIYGRSLDAAEVTEHYNGTYKNETDLLGAWHFDEGKGATISDDSGKGNNGKTAGPEWANGKIGDALDFGGMNGYVIKNPFNMPSTEVSTEFWMKTSDTIKNGTPISYAVSGSDNEFFIYNYNNFRLSIKGSTVTTGVSANDGVWHHIAATWRNSDGQLKLYKDGNPVYSGTLRTGATLTQGGALVFGQEQDNVGGGFSDSQAFLGLLDEVRIYNRVLDSAEITEHFNGIFTDESGLVGLWRFEEGSGTTAFDQSGNENNGTLYRGSTPAWQTDSPNILKVLPLENSKTYKYKVKAFSADSESDFSDEISVSKSCLPAKPDLVIALQCEEANPQLKLTWQSDANTKYWSVYKKRTDETFFTNIINISPPTASFTDGDIETGIGYEYYLNAVGVGVSTLSDIVSETAPFCYLPPSKPVITSATPQCIGYSSRVLIGWEEDLSDNTISYNIYRKNTTLEEAEFSPIYTGLPEDTNQYIDIVAEGNNFIYKVEAVGNGPTNTVFSDPSAELTSYECSKSSPFPPLLGINSILAIDHQIAVSIGWNDAGNEDNYKVFRRLAGESVFAKVNQSWLDRLFGGTSFAAYENPLVTLDADILNYVDYTITDGTTYEYQIMASNINGDTLSNIISVPVPVALPGDFVLSWSWAADNKIYFTWAEALSTEIGGVVTYEVLRDNTINFDSPTIICSGIASFPLECYDNNLVFSETYYKVVATNNGGSTDSNIIRPQRPSPIWKETTP